MELGERKLKILAAIIESYIRTGEPVGSKALTSALDNAVSSATIRNEMAELANLGYLDQPHTSAGRVPTAAAFRLYIDRLMPRKSLSDGVKKQIDELLASFAGDPDRLVSEASQALADVSGCARRNHHPLAAQFQCAPHRDHARFAAGRRPADDDRRRRPAQPHLPL